MGVAVAELEQAGGTRRGGWIERDQVVVREGELGVALESVVAAKGEPAGARGEAREPSRDIGAYGQDPPAGRHRVREYGQWTLATAVEADPRGPRPGGAAKAVRILYRRAPARLGAGRRIQSDIRATDRSRQHIGRLT